MKKACFNGLKCAQFSVRYPYKRTSADKILAFWDELGLTDFIYDMYEIYHTERLQNAFDDIDSLIAERTKTNTQPV